MRPEDLVGQTLGHYKLKRQIGIGGMATVFLAEDVHLGREVALKIFWPRPGETQDFLRRFTREARVLAQLDHPNILPVYDYGEQGEIAFLVVPYMAGGTLREMLQKRKALPPSEAIQLISQVLSALQYAHDRNLIHRDIKPGNLLFKADGSLMVADFGLVKVLEGDEREGIPLQTISESGHAIAGTPEYMSPEQINGRAVPASDIYSVGIVLYEMLAGSRPFQGTGLLSVLMKHINEAARPPRELNPYISPQLEAAILKALEKDLNKRFARPLDFLQALQQVGNPGSVNFSVPANVAGNFLPRGGQSASTELDLTLASNWVQVPAPDVQAAQLPRGLSNPHMPDVANNQPVSAYSPGTPTVAIDQPGMVGSWPAGQQPIGRPQAGNAQIPVTPFPVQQPAIQSMQTQAPAQTITPPFVPQQTRRSHTPLIVTIIMGVLVGSFIASLFLTPLGPLLFGPHLTATPPGQNTLTPGIGTPTGRGIPTYVPGSTQPLASTSTDCPATNSARAAVVAPLARGNDPTIVYIVNENAANGNPSYGTLKLFDTVNNQKTELSRMPQTQISEAQISDDGQWVLFAATVGEKSELRMVRLDGQGLQTLYCAPVGTSIKYSQWSIDQRYVIFDDFPQQGEPTVYLLNVQTGALQIEVIPPASGLALVARTWLDNTRVLMVGLIPGSDAPPENIYILNINGGARQNMAHISPVFTSTQGCWDFDSSYDSQTLFIVQCRPGDPNGSSMLGLQSATGGTLSPILNSSTLAFGIVRVIDPASTTLLALASNSSQGTTGSLQHDGLYILQANGSGTPRLLAKTPANTVLSLCAFSQYFWSNISRDHTMYALESTQTNTNGSEYILSYGQIGRGTPGAFTDYTQYLAIVGWTTI